MPLKPLAVPAPAVDLYEDYLAWLHTRGVGNKSFYGAGRAFLVRFPDPQVWARRPLAERLTATNAQGPLLRYLMLHGHLQPGYDFLLERKLHAVLRDAALSPLGPAVEEFLAGAERMGYSVRARIGMASEVAVRLLIESNSVTWTTIQGSDYAGFQQAVAESIEGCIVMHRGNLDSHRGSRREQEIAPADR